MMLKRKPSCNRELLENSYLCGKVPYKRFHIIFVEILLGIEKLPSYKKPDVINIRCWVSL